MPDRTQADVIKELTLAGSVAPTIIKLEHNVGSGTDLPEEIPLLATPKGPGVYDVSSVKKLIDEYRLNPERRKGTAVLADLDSFIDHANRFKNDDSVIFADPNPTSPSLTSVLNYHEGKADGEPRFGDHRGRYNFPLSDEWKCWIGKNGEDMGQAEFAEFIEDRIGDVLEPTEAMDSALKFAKSISCEFATPIRLVDLSRGLAIRVGGRIMQSVKLQSGESSLQFETTHQDESGAPLKVPGAVLLAIPVFLHGPLYQVPARLRYRTSNGMSWRFDLYRTDVIFQHAFQEAWERAKANTELPVLRGAPES